MSTFLKLVVPKGEDLWENGDRLVEKIKNESDDFSTWQVVNVKNSLAEDGPHYDALKKIIRESFSKIGSLRLINVEPSLVQLFHKGLSRNVSSSQLTKLDLSNITSSNCLHLLHRVFDFNTTLRSFSLNKEVSDAPNVSYWLVEALLKSKNIKELYYRDSDIIIVKALINFMNNDFANNKKEFMVELATRNYESLSLFDSFWTTLYKNFAPGSDVTTHGLHSESRFTKKFRFVVGRMDMHINNREYWGFDLSS